MTDSVGGFRKNNCVVINENVLFCPGRKGKVKGFRPRTEGKPILVGVLSSAGDYKGRIFGYNPQDLTKKRCTSEWEIPDFPAD